MSKLWDLDVEYQEIYDGDVDRTIKHWYWTPPPGGEFELFTIFFKPSEDRSEDQSEDQSKDRSKDQIYWKWEIGWVSRLRIEVTASRTDLG